MHAPNEKHQEKNRYGGLDVIWPKAFKDIFGYDIKPGAYVIWQPYSRAEGMHIGQVVKFTHDGQITIRTNENRIISRHGYELVLVMQHTMKLESMEY